MVLNVNPEGPSLSFENTIPITIGTVPFMDAHKISSRLPPSYEASMFQLTPNDDLEEKKKGEVTNMDANFAPYYPFYKDFSIVPH